MKRPVSFIKAVHLKALGQSVLLSALDVSSTGSDRLRATLVFEAVPPELRQAPENIHGTPRYNHESRMRVQITGDRKPCWVPTE